MPNVTSVVSLLLIICVSFSSVASREEALGKMGDGLVDYDKVLEAQKDESVLIIDVRENSEIEETGKLPGSIHIPMREILSELNLSSEEFKKKYGKNKPSLDTEIIISCRSGRRSKIVQMDLQKEGYNNVFSYSGGWLEWERRQNN